jgi:hypothetical protein
MRAAVTLAITSAISFAFADHCFSQIGETNDELIRRYGQCQPNPAGKPKGPNVYDSVIDVGEDCTFQHDDLTVTSMFKCGKAVAFYYRKEVTFWTSVLQGKSETYRELSEDEISTLLRTAVPGAQWVIVPSDPAIRRWQTSDSSAFAYYFANGHYNRHQLLVQTAPVDAMFKRVDKVIRGLRSP